ncbi:hypothetical protein IK146_00760 [Candidatus Saccharibacteria bacterium]|nr:hypothetical protein [Candidatus Saccharibacteria bacterium]
MTADSRHKLFQNPYLRLSILAIVVIVIAILLLSFVNGKHTTTGSFPDSVKTKSLECIASKRAYDKLNKGSTTNNDVRFVGIFDDSGSLIKLSFEYALSYENRGLLDAEEPYLRADFAKSLEKDGLSFDEFNNKFTIYENKNTLALYAEPEDLTTNTASYFLLDSKIIPSTLNDFQSAYEKQGFKCSSTTND